MISAIDLQRWLYANAVGARRVSGIGPERGSRSHRCRFRVRHASRTDAGSRKGGARFLLCRRRQMERSVSIQHRPDRSSRRLGRARGGWIRCPAADHRRSRTGAGAGACQWRAHCAVRSMAVVLGASPSFSRRRPFRPGTCGRCRPRAVPADDLHHDLRPLPMARSSLVSSSAGPVRRA